MTGDESGGPIIHQHLGRQVGKADDGLGAAFLNGAAAAQHKRPALAVFTTVHCVGQPHALGGHVDLILGQNEAQFLAVGKGRNDQQRQQHSDDAGQCDAKQAHEPVTPPAWRGELLPRCAFLVCLF